MPGRRTPLGDDSVDPWTPSLTSEPVLRDSEGPSTSRNGRPAMVRRVQRVGVSSLAVTLPKAWTDSMGVHLGDSVRFRNNGQGALEIALYRDGHEPPSESQPVTLVVTDAPTSLISNLIRSAYVSGQDRITLTTHKGLSEVQREEIHRTATRVAGLSVVTDHPDAITLQVSVDPTRRRLPSLIDHLTQLVQHELSLCRRALAQQSGALLAPVPSIEDDLTRTYLLLCRQLFIATVDPWVGQKIGGEDPQLRFCFHHVANALSAVGDQVSAMARYLQACMQSACFSGPSCADLGDKVARSEELLGLTMQAFNKVSASEAHLALSMIATTHDEFDSLMVIQTSGRRCTVLKQRLVSRLSTIGELLRGVNQESLERAVEPGTAARTNGQVVVANLAD